MKFFIAILSVVAFASAEYTDEEKEMWLDFKLEHGKLFLSRGKEKNRMDTFLKNAKEVKEHNEAFQNGEITYEAGLHAYSDLSEEEFLARFTGANMPADFRNVDPSEDVTLRQSLPASLNLTAVMGPGWKVRSQGGCGSCWAFASAATIESAYFNKYGVLLDVSEQQMVDCVYGTYGGCDGGWMTVAYDYLALNGGLALESDYPYTHIAASCRTNVSRAVFLNYTNSKSWKKVKGSVDDIIKTALNEKGVLTVCVDPNGWGNYAGGIFQSPTYANPVPVCSHLVAITGYGTDEATGIPYWTLRNSWGFIKFGEQGYIRVDARRDPVTGKPFGGPQLDTVYYPILV